MYLSKNKKQTKKTPHTSLGLSRSVYWLERVISYLKTLCNFLHRIRGPNNKTKARKGDMKKALRLVKDKRNELD